MLQMKSRWASVNPSKPGTRSPEVEEEEVTLPQGADEEGRKAWNSRSWFSIKSWLMVNICLKIQSSFTLREAQRNHTNMIRTPASLLLPHVFTALWHICSQAHSLVFELPLYYIAYYYGNFWTFIKVCIGGEMQPEHYCIYSRYSIQLYPESRIMCTHTVLSLFAWVTEKEQQKKTSETSWRQKH